MGHHIDRRGTKKGRQPERDVLARKSRASFKQYLRNIEEELLEDDLDDLDEEPLESNDDNSPSAG